MENKGLCMTCAYDGKCVFEKIFPVQECEEFTEIESKPKGRKNKKRRKS